MNNHLLTLCNMMKKGFLFLTVLKKRRLSTTAHTLNSVGSTAAVRLKQHPVRLRLASGIIQWWSGCIGAALCRRRRSW